jgi:ribulose-phosphate 3-epimerase
VIVISPSLLACDFLNIEKELRAFDNFKDFTKSFEVNLIQTDVLPNLLFKMRITLCVGIAA